MQRLSSVAHRSHIPAHNLRACIRLGVKYRLAAPTRSMPHAFIRVYLLVNTIVGHRPHGSEPRARTQAGSASVGAASAHRREQMNTDRAPCTVYRAVACSNKNSKRQHKDWADTVRMFHTASNLQLSVDKSILAAVRGLVLLGLTILSSGSRHVCTEHQAAATTASPHGIPDLWRNDIFG